MLTKALKGIDKLYMDGASVIKQQDRVRTDGLEDFCHVSF